MPYKRLSRFSETFSIPEKSAVLKKMEFFNSHRRLHSKSPRTHSPCPTPARRNAPLHSAPTQNPHISTQRPHTKEMSCDEFPVGYSLAGCPPAEPASASPTGDDSQQSTLPYNDSSANGNYPLNFVSQSKGALQMLPPPQPTTPETSDFDFDPEPARPLRAGAAWRWKAHVGAVIRKRYTMAAMVSHLVIIKIATMPLFCG